MIILKDILCGYRKSVQVELPRANMVIDPRSNDSNGFGYRPRFRCEYHENGTTVTLTEPNYYDSRGGTFSFRVYDPAIETVPSFDSTIYTYFGLDGERAPSDTTLLIIHPSVTVIKEHAFNGCSKIKNCFMHGGVHAIEERAFQSCSAMKVIRLSRNLTHIGERAFQYCSSLKAVFFPPSVNKIDKLAFADCNELEIFSLPLNMDISQIGKGVLGCCDRFFNTTHIQRYQDNFYDGYYDDYFDDYYINHEDVSNMYQDSNDVHQDIIHFYRNQVPPLHKACLDTHVTRQTIRQCINIHGPAAASITDHNGMTPLHILAMNSHANISALLACFHLNMSNAFVRDRNRKTPLDYLRAHRDNIEDHTSLVSCLCMHWDAVVASNQDNEETATTMNNKKKRVN